MNSITSDTRWMLVFLFFSLLVGGQAAAQDSDSSLVSAADSLRVVDVLHAETAVDSLRAQIRRLDGEIQSMKQDLSSGANVEALLAALTDEPATPDAPEDIRSRRQRVDTLLHAITQRPGQLRFNGSATTVIQDLVGGDVDGAAGTGTVDIYASTSFGPETLLFFAFEVGSGVGLDSTLPLITPINGDAAPTRGREEFDQLALREAWAEFTVLDEAMTFTVGKLDLTNYFDINRAANDETSQFLSGAFVNSAALLAPAPAPGVRARTTLFGRLSVQGAVTSADSTGGTHFQDAFAIGSVGIRTFPNSHHDGNLQAYLYAPAHVGGAKGWGLSLDQRVAGAATLFGRLGRNESGLLSMGGAKDAWSAGVAWAGALRGHQLTAAVAWGEAEAADGLQEHNLEIYASWQVNTWTFVSPHLQVVRNDEVSAKSITLAGVRVQFNF